MNHIKYTSTIVLALCCTTAAFAQQKRISGHVYSKADGAIVMATSWRRIRVTVLFRLLRPI